MSALHSTVLAVIASYQSGFNMAITSSALLYLKDSFIQLKDSPALSSLVVAIAIFGAILGAPLFARLSVKIGSRQTLYYINALYFVSTVLLSLSNSLWMVILFRCIVGVAAGGSTTIVPIYVSVVAPTAQNGRYGSFIQVAVTSGILTSYLVGYGLSFVQTREPWRLMFAFPSIFPILFLLLSSWIGLIESPSLGPNHVTLPSHVPSASEESKALMERTEEANTESSSSLFSKENRCSMLKAIGVQLIQQFSGFNAIVYYSGVIFNEMGFDRQMALLTSFLSTLPQLGSLYVTSRTVDRYGRKPILLVSCIALALCLFSVGLVSLLISDTSAVYRKALLVVLILLARLSFSVGLGPIPAFLAPELLPPSIRVKGMGLASLSNWLANGVVTLSFLPLIQLEQIIWHYFGADYNGERLVLVYWIYALILLFGVSVIRHNLT